MNELVTLEPAPVGWCRLAVWAVPDDAGAGRIRVEPAPVWHPHGQGGWDASGAADLAPWAPQGGWWPRLPPWAAGCARLRVEVPAPTPAVEWQVAAALAGRLPAREAAEALVALAATVRVRPVEPT